MPIKAPVLLSGQASEPLVARYESILRTGSDKQKQSLTGWSSADKIKALPTNLATAPVVPALERYTGVGFQYLNIATLNAHARAYLDTHLVIFSHLFGPLRATDLIPETKLKQTTRFAGKQLANYFNEQTAQAVEQVIDGRPVLDVRAGLYERFFTPTTPTITCGFTKQGKTVSHWSKAYRGVVARQVAIHQPGSIEALLAIPMPGLKQAEVTTSPSGVHVSYRVVDASTTDD